MADPNFAPMYATRYRRVKTDRRDAYTLMEACRLGAYREAHRSSDARRHVRAQLAVREALVRTRTRYTAIIKSLVRRDGLRARGSAAHLLQEKITALYPSPQLLDDLQPLFEMIVPLNAQIEAADDRISALERTDPAVALLMTVPGIGAITASAVVGVADDITRFDSAHQFEAFLDLVPGELSSGDKRRIGHITKAGNARVRYLPRRGRGLHESANIRLSSISRRVRHCLTITAGGSRHLPKGAASHKAASPSNACNN